LSAFKLSLLVTLLLNAAAESQKFTGMIDIRHSWLDVTFCDCRLGGAGSIMIVDDSSVYFDQLKVSLVLASHGALRLV
jgi:hypothetical protein